MLKGTGILTARNSLPALPDFRSRNYPRSAAREPWKWVRLPTAIIPRRSRTAFT